MLRTAAERASLLRAWRADPRHKGLEPPVEIVAPGSKAARWATATQKKAVQALMRQQADEVAALDLKHMRALLPVFRQAQEELGARLKHWIETTPDGELRWTAWREQGALVQMHAITKKLEEALHGELERGGAATQRLALDHMIEETARLSKVFGDDAPALRLDLVRLLATGEASMVPRYRSSAERYAWGKKYGVYTDLKNRLAVDIAAGAPLHETIDRLQEHGGPRGLVALEGVKGEEGALVELIPEGLFKRYRWRAEMFVRTEYTAAYGAQMKEGLDFASHFLPDLMWRWATDGTGCARICQPMDGQVVGLNEPFIDGEGHTVDGDGGAHPNCRCRRGAWRAHWPMLLDSLGIN